MKRFNLVLEKDMHSQAKIISVLKNIPLNKYLESCIKKGLKDDRKILETLKTNDSLELD